MYHVLFLLRPLENFLVVWRRHHVGLCSAPMSFEYGGIFIVPHLLWCVISDFAVSSRGPPYRVAFNSNQEALRTCTHGSHVLFFNAKMFYLNNDLYIKHSLSSTLLCSLTKRFSEVRGLIIIILSIVWLLDAQITFTIRWILYGQFLRFFLFLGLHLGAIFVTSLARMSSYL